MSRRILIVAVAALIAGGLVGLVTLQTKLFGSARSVSTGQALVGGPFALTGPGGKTVRDSDFRGKYMLIYFGFAQCPDICPAALQVISTALDQIGDKVKKVQPIFITLDPERDAPDVMAAYVSAFHPKMIGLTGTPETIAKAAKAYRVFYRKVPDPGSANAYTVDHSSIVYLMGPDGKFVTHFTHGTDPDVMAKRLKEVIKSRG